MLRKLVLYGLGFRLYDHCRPDRIQDLRAIVPGDSETVFRVPTEPKCPQNWIKLDL